jgi:hypothetical protein
MSFVHPSLEPIGEFDTINEYFVRKKEFIEYLLFIFLGLEK